MGLCLTYWLGRWSRQKHRLQIPMRPHHSPGWTLLRWIPRSLRLHLRREENLISPADPAAPNAGFPNSRLLGNRPCEELNTIKDADHEFYPQLAESSHSENAGTPALGTLTLARHQNHQIYPSSKSLSFRPASSENSVRL